MKFKFIKVLVLATIGIFLLNGCMDDKDLGKQNSTDGSKEFKVVTSFYPIYIETLNVTKDIQGVKVENMTNPQTGCLHDYSLTPANMKTLESANVFVINGAGMETFMDKVVKQQHGLKIIEASKGMKFLKNNLDNEENPHVWMSISDCILQVKNIEKQLSSIDPTNASAYKRNSDEYVKKLESKKDEMHKVLDNLKNKDIITFHEAFPYFAKEFNLNIVAVIEREPGSEPSPKELKNTIRIIKKSKTKALFAEPQYSKKAAKTIANETGIKMYNLDPAVTGDGSLNSYLNIMDQNLKSLEKALK